MTDVDACPLPALALPCWWWREVNSVLRWSTRPLSAPSHTAHLTITQARPKTEWGMAGNSCHIDFSRHPHEMKNRVHRVRGVYIVNVHTRPRSSDGGRPPESVVVCRWWCNTCLHRGELLASPDAAPPRFNVCPRCVPEAAIKGHDHERPDQGGNR